MSIRLPVTKAEIRKIEQALAKKIDFVCLDELIYIKALLIGREMLMHGKDVKAKIVKGY